MASKNLPRRDEIVTLLASSPRPLHAREIAAALSVSEGAYLEMLGVLADLALEGLVRALPGQRFKAAPGRSELLEGIIHVHPRGFGFVTIMGAPDDLFIPVEAMGGAMHRDRVRVRIVGTTRRGSEGVVDSVVGRGRVRVAGTLQRKGKSAWLDPDDARVRGPVVLPGLAEGKSGDAAVVELTRYPERADENPEGVLVECFGPATEATVEVRKILVREGIEECHSDEAIADAKCVAVPPDPSLFVGREDLRGVPLVTIDPDDARDHDDAIWVGYTETGFEAWVAIADVAHYVREQTALDESARDRSFSVYLPDRAIPMLPAQLSSDVCSLREGEERLCLAVHVRVDGRGQVRGAKVVEGVMRSRARLTYSGVARGMKWSDVQTEHDVPEELRADLDVADQLAHVLRKRRMRRGSLDLQVPEPKIVLDDRGEPVDVRRRAEDPGVRRAYQLIEDLMLLANEAVAEWMMKREVSPVFRVHPPPDEAKLERLATLCNSLGIEFDPEEASDPKRLGAFLTRVSDHELFEIISMLTLRSLKQASYDLANVGHFGLALRAYVHFTSPIRRYPDLLVHREVKRALRGQLEQSAQEKERREQALEEAVMQSKQRERAVMEVEREVADVYRAWFMRDRVGLEVMGTVVEMLGSSLVVALDDPFVEVRVPLDQLGRDSYEIAEDGLRVVGMRSGEEVRLGDRMLVRVIDSNVGRRTTQASRIASSESAPTRKRHKKRNQPEIVGKSRKHLKKRTKY